MKKKRFLIVTYVGLLLIVLSFIFLTNFLDVGFYGLQLSPVAEQMAENIKESVGLGEESVEQQVVCEENWECSEWSSCENEEQTRSCEDANGCGTENEKPEIKESCEEQEDSTAFRGIFEEGKILFEDSDLNYFTFPEEVPVFNIKLEEKNFHESVKIPLNYEDEIIAISVSVEGTILDKNSYARILVEDESGNKYLVFASDFFGLSTNFITKGACEESCNLGTAKKLKQLLIEIKNAELKVNNLEAIKKESKDALAARESILSNQERIEINRWNEVIQKNNLRWVAGETSISDKTYEEQRFLFNLPIDGKSPDELPNLFGFQFYKEGVFETIVENKVMYSGEGDGDSSTGFPNSWDWRNAHGSTKFLTNIKDQLSCGSCWAFGTTAALESATNIYFNTPNKNLDLSEQEAVSCSGAGNCAVGGSSYYLLDYIKSQGLVDEACFPYRALDIPCNKCSSPSEKIKIAQVKTTPWLVDYGICHPATCTGQELSTAINLLREYVIKGDAVVVNIPSMRHAMQLVGYNGKEYIFKNSWGEIPPEGGYVRIWKHDLSDFNVDIGIPPITSEITPREIKCTDRDNDAFCYWGQEKIKPSSGCPSSCTNNHIKDCNDGDNTIKDKIGDYKCNMPQCLDGIDNDGDGFTDYPNDFGCHSPVGHWEMTKDITTKCNNGKDDYDFDYLVDENDPDCSSWDDTEDAQCEDHGDNDNDGYIDWGQDGGCQTPGDDSEENIAQCQDGIDNDGDFCIDYCVSGNNCETNPRGCSSPSDNDESPMSTGCSQCSDEIDNDGDGFIDYYFGYGINGDIDCRYNPFDNSESSRTMLVKNSQGEKVAGFYDTRGSILLKGTCRESTLCQTSDNLFVFTNRYGATTAYIDSNGNMCVKQGCNIPSYSCSGGVNDFLFQDETFTNRIVIKEGGELCYTGNMQQNVNVIPDNLPQNL